MLFGCNIIGGVVLVKIVELFDVFGGKVRLCIGDDNLCEVFVVVDLLIMIDLLSCFLLGIRKCDGYVMCVYDG